MTVDGWDPKAPAGGVKPGCAATALWLGIVGAFSICRAAAYVGLGNVVFVDIYRMLLGLGLIP